MKPIEIIGLVSELLETEQINDTFQKRKVIVKTVEQYPQVYAVEFSNDKIELTESLKKGDAKKFVCRLDGRTAPKDDGEDMYFLSLACWKIEELG